MIKIGITGNIASGKSEFENILKNKSFLVYDLDNIVHDLYKNNEITDKLLKEFSTLDRKKIADIIFKNKNKKKALENIIYPKLKEIIFELFEKNKQEEIIFISGALLFESGFNSFFDKIVFIDAPKDIRLERLKKRNNLDNNKALERINSQSDLSKSQANYIILNDKTLDELKNKTDEFLKEI